MMTFENISSIQIIGTKWKFHACPASRYALRVAAGKNPRKLSLSGLHSRRPWLSWAGIIALMKSAIITREPLSRVLNQDFRPEHFVLWEATCLHFYQQTASFITWILPGDSNCWAYLGNLGSDQSSDRAHSLVAEHIDDGIRISRDRGSRGWYRACYS